MSVHTVNKIVLSYRTAKADARTAIGAHTAEMETTPFRQISNPNRKPFSNPSWTPAGPQANRDSRCLQCCDGRGCQKIPRRRQPLPSQLVSWEKSSPAQRQFYTMRIGTRLAH